MDEADAPVAEIGDTPQRSKGDHAVERGRQEREDAELSAADRAHRSHGVIDQDGACATTLELLRHGARALSADDEHDSLHSTSAPEDEHAEDRPRAGRR